MVLEDEMRFCGVASSTALDRQREQMTEGALEGMGRLEGLELRAGHRGEKRVGMVEEGWVEEGVLRVRGVIEDEGLAERVRRGERLALSVGGKVRAASWGWRGDAEGPVRMIEGVELEHVAVCRREEAVNPDAVLEVDMGAGKAPE